MFDATTALEWRMTDVPAEKRRVKGTILARAIFPVENCRWAVEEVQMYDEQRLPLPLFRVRDAMSLTDAEIRANKLPDVVYSSYSCLECCRWVGRQVSEIAAQKTP